MEKLKAKNFKAKICTKKNDVRFIVGDTNFKFRVAGIIDFKNKILLTKMNDNKYFCLPGGHIEIGEDSFKAVERELKEELFFDFKIKKLLFVNENFYKKQNKNFHEVCFYFLVVPKEKDLKLSDCLKKEFDNGKVVDHQFVWVNKKDLENMQIKPYQIVLNSFKNKKTLKHFITNEN